MRIAIALPFLLIAAAAMLRAGEGPEAAGALLIRDARIVTIDRAGELAEIERGSVLARGGRIEKVGPGLEAPEGAAVVDAAGRWLLPGFIDAHHYPSVLYGEGNEFTQAITEGFEPAGALDPWDPELARRLELGITALALAPGDRSVIGGKVQTVKVLPEEYPVRPLAAAPAVKASVSRSALGSPGLPRYPTALSGAIELFQRWAEERASLASGSLASGGGRAGAVKAAGNPGAGAVVPAASAREEAAAPRKLSWASQPPPAAERILIHVDDRTRAERVLEILEDKPLLPVLVHGRGIDRAGWDLIASCPPVILGPFDLGDPARTLEAPAALERRGVPVAFASDGLRRDLLTTAVLARRHGLSRRGALAALTEHPALILGLEERLGRIEPGLDADLVLWSGDPFSLAARVEGVWVEGKRIYDRGAGGAGEAK